MIHGLQDLRSGFDHSCDAVVVGSGAGGAVAAANLAAAGMKVALVEAGPRLRAADMTRDGPRFLARYFWEGGLRMLGGSAEIPSLQGRCLGGSTVVNSAIMFALPRWVREAWAAEADLPHLLDDSLDRAFSRIMDRTGVRPTPMAVMGRRNLAVKAGFEGLGISGAPLPRAVVDCEGCGDCITGCPRGHKCSVDRSWLPDARRDGAEIFCCAQVDRVLTEGVRATGVRGRVVDPAGRRTVASFTVRAPRVILAAGVLATPVILLRSGIHAHRTVGRTFYCHVGGALLAVMEEPVEPWIGATQGWGAFSPEHRGMKFECLWGPPSLMATRYGDVGERFLEQIAVFRHSTIVAVVYRGRVHGRVRAGPDGLPRARVRIPRSEVRVVLRGLRTACEAMLGAGARYVYTGTPGTRDEMYTPEEVAAIVDPRTEARHLRMTANHVFGSCPMAGRPGLGTVDPDGKVYGCEGLYVVDSSIFPSPSAVNPQATVMALSDLVSRRLGELPV